jgi:hypothetical protein
MDIITFDKRKNKKVLAGRIENTTFIREVNPSKHFIKNFNGYAIQSEVFQQLQRLNVRSIRFVENTGRQLAVSLDGFISNGISFDYGHGHQIACDVKRMTVIDPNQSELV